MRFALMLVLFIFVGVTLTGSLLTALLSAPVETQKVWDLFPWIAAGGFAMSLLVSYIIADRILKQAGGNTG